MTETIASNRPLQETEEMRQSRRIMDFLSKDCLDYKQADDLDVRVLGRALLLLDYEVYQNKKNMSDVLRDIKTHYPGMDAYPIKMFSALIFSPSRAAHFADTLMRPKDVRMTNALKITVCAIAHHSYFRARLEEKAQKVLNTSPKKTFWDRVADFIIGHGRH